MDLSLDHHFDADIETVWSMLHDPDAHIAKFAFMGHTDIVVLSSDVTDESLDLTLRRIVHIDVPSVAKKFLKPTNQVTSTDHWERRPDGTCGGHYSAELKGVPVETTGETKLVPDADGTGCTYTIKLRVKVKVPLVGETVAGALRPQLEKQVRSEFEAGEAWLAAH